MRKLIVLSMLGFATLSHGSNLLTYSVFSKSDINYARSDFEGRVGAGGNISVEDFSFVPGLEYSGVKTAGSFRHIRGANNSSINAGYQALISNVRMNGSIASSEVVLNESTITGPVTANQLRVGSYGGNLNAYYGGFKKISSNEANDRQVKLNYEMTSLGLQLDNLSRRCEALPATKISVMDGTLTLSGNSQMNVFEIDGERLYEVSEIIFNTPATSTVVINVSGSEVFLDNMGVRLNTTDERKIIWNMYEAKSLIIHHAGSREIRRGRAVGLPGLFIAPSADAEFFEALITGGILVNKLQGNLEGMSGGQVNYAPFNGIPCAPKNEGKPGGKG